MLTVKCAACRRKLWKYDKVGRGQLLRCHKDRITPIEPLPRRDGKIYCHCGKPIGIDKGGSISMIAGAFIHTGSKRNG